MLSRQRIWICSEGRVMKESAGNWTKSVVVAVVVAVVVVADVAGQQYCAAVL